MSKKKDPVKAPSALSTDASQVSDGKIAASRGGFLSTPADSGLSIDRLAQAFAAMMGPTDPYGETAAGKVRDGGAAVVEVDPSPDIDSADNNNSTYPVTPKSILEAMLFVGLPGGEPIVSRNVAALMRGVRAQEIDELAGELADGYRANDCPYEIIAKDSGWVLQLRAELMGLRETLSQRARQVTLTPEALDVLSVVAWNQPAARDRLVELGCDAPPSLLRQLVRRGLLILDHPIEGPPSYSTTKKFLDIFKLQRIEDLPKIGEPPA